jgi:Protein of unknown function (DUF3352)
MKETLGVGWAQLRDDILGDALVLAYRPGPPGKPDQEQGILLLRARDGKVLAKLIERINKVQKDEGDLKELEPRRYKGVTYYRRLQYDKRTQSDKPAEYYYVHGPILALSSQESMLQQAMDCDRTRPVDALPEPARRLRELGAERALMAMWINPRAFDAELQSKIAAAPAEHTGTLKHFALYWKALDSVVLSLSLTGREINLSLGMHARVGELPPAARRLLREASLASDVWRRIPDSALFALGGRIDGAALLDVIEGFLTEENRRELRASLKRQLASVGGQDFGQDLLSGLGPDWGLYVAAPAAGSKNWIPQTVLALRFNPSRAKKTLERKLSAALDFAARFVVVLYNTQHSEQPVTLETTEVDGQEVHYVASESGLPDGVSPSYGLLSGYLLASSSLDALSRFAKPSPSPSLSADSPIPLLRISLKDWRAYVKDRREAIVDFFAEQSKLNRDAIGRQLDNLITGLQFLDRIEIRQKTAPGQVIFTFSVQTTQALNKN